MIKSSAREGEQEGEEEKKEEAKREKVRERFLQPPLPQARRLFDGLGGLCRVLL